MKNFKFTHNATGDLVFTAKEKDGIYYITWTDKDGNKDFTTYTKEDGDFYISQGLWILKPVKIKAKIKENNYGKI